MSTLPPMIQSALNLSEASRAYAKGNVSEDAYRAMVGEQVGNVTQSLTPSNTVAQFDNANYVAPPAQQQQGPQFDRAVTDFTPQEQQLVTQISNQMGLAAAPAGIINGQIVDLNGNPIAGAPSVEDFGNMMAGIAGGSMSLNDVARRTDVQGQALAAPQTGLIGSEQALTGGLSGSIDATMQGAEMARNDIQSAGQTAQQQLDTGRGQVIDAALNTNQMVQQGLQGGRADVINTALEAQRMGSAPLDPFLQQGQQAAQLQGALSGAQGQNAQQQAYNQFNESPGQAFLREQAERGTTRNAAAIGGLGGGRVRQELQRQAMGLAQQDFGNYYNRLGQVAGQGLTAGSQISGLTGQLGSNLMGQLGGFANTGAGITGNLGSNLMGQLGSSQQLGAQITQAQGQNLGNIAQQTGFGIGQNILGTGQQIGADRMQAGRDMSQNITGITGGLSDLANQYGMSVSDLIGLSGGNIANLLSGTGSQIAAGQQNLGTGLANTYMGQGSQSVSVPGVPGVQQTQDTLTPMLGGVGGLATGIGALI